MRTFLKKSAVPSVFPWMKSKTQAQLDGEKREQKRHESKVLRLAEQWSTDKANKDEEKIGRGFGKNAGEWTGRVEISEEEIPGSKRSMYGYILTYSRL